ncbi:MAG: V-type ATP synthase subunit B [Candidatus Bipolaricaulota bacterium]|nr:V-type ATP synthase subunit B [Candidatus Bipolaricaulota bacterium]MCS7275148.1 V-type ATP synthase subunit B [Candidatus Bipolaricaulota bacterium]MDW8111601.1 V-type ATP synthase subunit B [Candidatus Bipolaricaulota bacterium]MDW8329694.1 V-type ATP synthase subunit B [Candidatus Bipolaricaulota bacterium]
MSTPLYAKAHRTITEIKGPLVFLQNVSDVRYGERVTLVDSAGHRKSGQVLEVGEDLVVVQVFEGSDGLDKKGTAVFFSGDVVKLGLSEDMLGRVFDGSGNPRDGLGDVLPETERPITGSPLNPVCRQQPFEFIETGISAIDLMNTLVKGQKLPIFTGAGLPANRVAVQIARQVIRQSKEELIVVFAGMGITSREYSYFYKEFQDSGALANSVLFLNLADDPTIERILTPRLALTTAEYFAFDKGRDVLVILTDMLNYANALREISSAREEIPGRRGYPGYLYTDLATNYERAGIIKGQKGSVTQLPIVTMPNDDITHPVIDLTGYITEGQIILSRDLDRRGIYPPINPLPSLSRLMNLGIGKGKTREDHRQLQDQLYALYAQGKEIEKLTAIIGSAGLGTTERQILRFTERFEREFINQGEQPRTIQESLNLGWELLSEVSRSELRRVEDKYIDQYLPKKAAAAPS